MQRDEICAYNIVKSLQFFNFYDTFNQVSIAVVYSSSPSKERYRAARISHYKKANRTIFFNYSKVRGE